MALDPNEIVQQGWWQHDEFPNEVALPAGIEKSKDYYAYYRTYRDGRREIEWYKRGTGKAGDGDPIVTRSNDEVSAVKSKWTEAQAKEKAQAGKTVKRKFPGIDPDTKLPAIVTEFEDGTFAYDSSTAATQRQGSEPPKEKDEGGRRYVWNPQANGGRGEWVDVGPAPTKPAEPPKERVDPANPRRRQQWDPSANNGAGAWVDAGEVAADPSKPPQERVNPADPTKRQRWDPQANNGQGEWVDAGTVAQDPAKPPQERVNPSDPTRRQRWDPKANGGQGEWVDAGSVAQAGAGHRNIEPFVPDPTQPDLGLGAWAAKHRSKIGLPADQGGITQAEWNAAGTEAKGQAEVYITNITNAHNVTRQSILDDRNEKNTLSNQSAADYQRAQHVFDQVWKYTKPGSRAIMGLIPGIMHEQAAFRQQRESQLRPMPALHPLFQLASVNSAATAAPPNSPRQAPAQSPAPSQPAAAPAAMPAQPPAAAQPLPPPIFRPMPPVEMPPQPQSMGQPGPFTGFAQSAMAAPPPPMPPAEAPPMNPALSNVVAQAGMPRFNPFPVAGRLASLGIPASAVAEAMVELGYS